MRGGEDVGDGGEGVGVRGGGGAVAVAPEGRPEVVRDQEEHVGRRADGGGRGLLLQQGGQKN